MFARSRMKMGRSEMKRSSAVRHEKDSKMSAKKSDPARFWKPLMLFVRLRYARPRKTAMMIVAMPCVLSNTGLRHRFTKARCVSSASCTNQPGRALRPEGMGAASSSLCAVGVRRVA